jgi:hypothetical protein
MTEGPGGQPDPEQEEEGWLPDPDHEGQERFWDGAAWTDEVRPDGSEDARRIHLPDHVPELQRALAAATADIDEVEDRLSSLFDRSEGRAPGEPRPPRPVRLQPEPVDPDLELHEEPSDAAPIHDEFVFDDFYEEPELFDDDLEAEADDDVDAEGDEDEDDEAFADLDAALAAESPEEI